MKGKSFLLLSIVVILLGVNIADSPANGPNPKAKLPSLGPAEPRTAMPSGPVAGLSAMFTPKRMTTIESNRKLFPFMLLSSAPI